LNFKNFCFFFRSLRLANGLPELNRCNLVMAVKSASGTSVQMIEKFYAHLTEEMQQEHYGGIKTKKNQKKIIL